jgi:hypothetical protein
MLWFINKEDGALVSSIRPTSPGDYAGSSLHVSSPPPSCATGEWAVWSGDAWSCVVDMRGTTWHHPDTLQMLTISLVGERPPAGWVAGPPASPANGRAIIYSVEGL